MLYLFIERGCFGFSKASMSFIVSLFYFVSKKRSYYPNTMRPASTCSPNCMAQNTHQRTCMPAVWHQCFVYQGSCFLLLKYISATRLKTTAKWCCVLEKGCSYARQIGHCPLELWHKLFIFALEEHLTHCSLPNEFQTNWFRKVPLGWFGRQCNGKLWSTVFTEQQEGKGEVESSVAKWSLVTQTSVVSVEMCIKGYTHQTLCWQGGPPFAFRTAVIFVAYILDCVSMIWISRSLTSQGVL